MKKFKVFLSTFLSTIFLMGLCYFALYLSMQGKSALTGEEKQGVPIAKPGVNDSKTIFLCIGEENPFFFIFKFNAIEGKISTVCISPDYIYKSTEKSITESFNKAGVMQCVYDTNNEFNINIDYFLQTSWKNLKYLTENFKEFDIYSIKDSIPNTVQEFLVKDADKIDCNSLINAIEKVSISLTDTKGLNFLSQTADLIIKNNISNLSNATENTLKKNYNRFNTNINTEDMTTLNRIFQFLTAHGVEYYNETITPDNKNVEEIINIAFN